MFVKSFSVLLLSSLGTASPWYRRDADILPGLSIRQAENDPPICFAPCDVNTCGGGSCGIPGLSRRSFDDFEALFSSFASINISHTLDEGESGDTQSISKRIWRFDATSDKPVGTKAPTRKQADSYLPAVFDGAENGYFRAPRWLSFDNPPDERAYSQQETFGTRPFQIMTGGIHGCTTITLVSNRGVWMAHFWETYSNRVRYDRETFDENSDEPPDHPVFEQRVLAFILGQPVNDPAPNFDKPYIPPTGPSPDPNLFNRDTDETKLFISTPIPLGQQLSLRRFQLRYPRRVQRIADAFEQRIGRSPEVNIMPYQALNYNVPSDRAQVGKGARGHHLFQYDPDSDGKGQRAWRYFAEDRYRQEAIV